LFSLTPKPHLQILDLKKSSKKMSLQRETKDFIAWLESETPLLQHVLSFPVLLLGKSS
jgi:hypothetical protein